MQESHIEKDNDEDFENRVIKLVNPNLNLAGHYHVVEISDNRRPIYGVLTEPIRGNMKSKTNNEGEQSEEFSYIPKAHVQFLEQSGIRVVPISYTDT